MIKPALRLRVARGPVGTKKASSPDNIYSEIRSSRTTRWGRSRSPSKLYIEGAPAERLSGLAFARPIRMVEQMTHFACSVSTAISDL